MSAGRAKDIEDAMVRRLFVLSTLLAVALLVSGCSATLTPDQQQALAEAASRPATLQPGDKINVVVFGEQGLSGSYELDQAGQISVPLAGTMKVQGMTQSELEKALARKFRTQYLRNPKVTVTIASLAPYYIIGEIKSPGQKAYRSGLNVLTAIANAGGPTYRAARNTVEIQRRGETSMTQYPISTSVPVLPGDVIKVPQRYF
jgi:protein involved in polysaccharide export with SLBB domain